MFVSNAHHVYPSPTIEHSQRLCIQLHLLRPPAKTRRSPKLATKTTYLIKTALKHNGRMTRTYTKHISEIPDLDVGLSAFELRCNALELFLWLRLLGSSKGTQLVGSAVAWLWNLEHLESGAHWIDHPKSMAPFNMSSAAGSLWSHKTKLSV